MKWMVAGAGALLSLAGVYALITGSSIVQVERGWSMVIAGAVILAAGAVLLGMAALMAKMEQLAKAYLGASAPAFGRPAFSPAPEAAPAADERPLPSRFARASAAAEDPVADIAPARPAVEVEAAPAPASAAEPAGSPGLRDFQFVFPTADAEPAPAAAAAPQPAPVRETPSRVEPLRPSRPAPSPAASRFASQWLRRNKETPVAPAAPVEPSAPSGPEPQSEAEPHAFAEPSAVFVAAESNVVELRVESPAQVAPEEPAPAVFDTEAPTAPVEPDADPFSADWLERAIAAGEAEAEASLTHPQDAAPAPAPEAAAVADEGEPAPAEASAGSDAAPTATVAEPLEVVERTSTPAPVEIGRYKANDVAYVMYADGSITAETPAGDSYRFSSLLELRKFIEKGGP